MGEVRELKRYEIVIVDVNNKQFIGKALIDDKETPPAIDTYTLINPALIFFQTIPQQTKMGGVEFAIITQIISLGMDELNIDKEDLIWGIVTSEQIKKQYEDTFQENRKLVNA
jgi:uncharacterized membrane protein